jgi:hypothetical protein
MNRSYSFIAGSTVHTSVAIRLVRLLFAFALVAVVAPAGPRRLEVRHLHRRRDTAGRQHHAADRFERCHDEQAVGAQHVRQRQPHVIDKPGVHTLTFWMIDPTVIAQSFVIDAAASRTATSDRRRASADSLRIEVDSLGIRWRIDLDPKEQT